MPNTKRQKRTRSVVRRHTFVQKPHARHQTHDSARPVAATTAAPEFGALVMEGTCVACKGAFRAHFNTEGQFVGCNPAQKPTDEFAAMSYIPPVLVPSSVLNTLLQSRTGAVIRPAAIAVAPAVSNEPKPRQFGRTPDLIYPLKEAVGEDVNDKTRAVLDTLNRHKDGITFNKLEAETGLPYSTVWQQVNKLVSMRAAERRQPTAA